MPRELTLLDTSHGPPVITDHRGDGVRVGIGAWVNLEADEPRTLWSFPLSPFIDQIQPMPGADFPLGTEMNLELAHAVGHLRNVDEVRVLSNPAREFPGVDYVIEPVMLSIEQRRRTYTYGLWVFGPVLSLVGLPHSRTSQSLEWQWRVVDPLSGEVTLMHPSRIVASMPIQGLPPFAYLYGRPLVGGTLNPARVIGSSFRQELSRFAQELEATIRQSETNMASRRADARDQALEVHTVCAGVAPEFYTRRTTVGTGLRGAAISWPPTSPGGGSQ